MTLSMKTAVTLAQLLEVGIGQLLPNLVKDFWRKKNGGLKMAPLKAEPEMCQRESRSAPQTSPDKERRCPQVFQTFAPKQGNSKTEVSGQFRALEVERLVILLKLQLVSLILHAFFSNYI